MADKCYHLMLEQYFGCDKVINSDDKACSDTNDVMRSYCSCRSTYLFPLVASSGAIIDVLNMYAFRYGPCNPKKIIEALNRSLHKIFNGKKTDYSNEHAEGLLLRLIAKGIITTYFNCKTDDNSSDLVLAKWSSVDMSTGDNTLVNENSFMTHHFHRRR